MAVRGIARELDRRVESIAVITKLEPRGHMVVLISLCPSGNSHISEVRWRRGKPRWYLCKVRRVLARMILRRKRLTSWRVPCSRKLPLVSCRVLQNLAARRCPSRLNLVGRSEGGVGTSLVGAECPRGCPGRCPCSHSPLLCRCCPRTACR